MFYLRMHGLLLLYHSLLMFMHSFLLGFREITVKNSYNELYIHIHMIIIKTLLEVRSAEQGASGKLLLKFPRNY